MVDVYIVTFLADFCRYVLINIASKLQIMISLIKVKNSFLYYITPFVLLKNSYSKSNKRFCKCNKKNIYRDITTSLTLRIHKNCS